MAWKGNFVWYLDCSSNISTLSLTISQIHNLNIKVDNEYDKKRLFKFYKMSFNKIVRRQSCWVSILNGRVVFLSFVGIQGDMFLHLRRSTRAFSVPLRHSTHASCTLICAAFENIKLYYIYKLYIPWLYDWSFKPPPSSILWPRLLVILLLIDVPNYISSSNAILWWGGTKEAETNSLKRKSM